MARIRSVKPEFWTDEKTGPLSLLGKCFFIGLFNHADDYGVLEIRPAEWRIKIFPYNSEITPGALTECLMSEIIPLGLAQIFEVGGKKYLFVTNFVKHQLVNRPSKPLLPGWTKATTPENYQGASIAQSESAPAVRTVETVSTPEPIHADTVNTHGVLTTGKEGKGEEGKGEGKERKKERVLAQPRAESAAPREEGGAKEVLEKPMEIPKQSDRWDELAIEIVAAFEDSGNPNIPNPHNEIPLWRKMGYEPEIILAVVRRGLENQLKYHDKHVKNLRYFVNSIQDAHTEIEKTSAKVAEAKSARAAVPAPPPAQSAAVWENRVIAYKKQGIWAPPFGPTPETRGCQAPIEILVKHGFGEAHGIKSRPIAEHAGEP